MEQNTLPGTESEVSVSGTALDMSTQTVFGVPRRVIGFGFGLFLMLAILAFVYAQFVDGPVPALAPGGTFGTPSEPLPLVQPEMGTVPKSETIQGPVTVDRAADDLIDEALADRDDLSSYDADEVADVTEGNNN